MMSGVLCFLFSFACNIMQNIMIFIILCIVQGALQTESDTCLFRCLNVHMAADANSVDFCDLESFILHIWYNVIYLWVANNYTILHCLVVYYSLQHLREKLCFGSVSYGFELSLEIKGQS